MSPLLLVRFGAGASYDSVDESRMRHMAALGHVDFKPQLATGPFERRQLWDDILQNLPECVALVDALRRDVSNGTQVEQALDEFQQRADGGDVVQSANNGTGGRGG